MPTERSLTGLKQASTHPSARPLPRPDPRLATVRIGPILGVPEVLRELGHEPATVLGELGIELALFDDAENVISYVERARLLGHCAARTGCPHFGLLVGERGRLQGFGAVGLLAQHSTSVQDALQRLVRFLHLHVRGAAADLSIDGDLAKLRYEIHLPDVEGVDQLGDGAVATMFNILRSLCGPGWAPVDVRFAHRKPADERPYRRFFGVRPAFDAGEYAVLFDVSWLERSMPASDPELTRLLQDHVSTLAAKHTGRVVEQVRAVLHASIVAGHASEGDIAALFALHHRALNRRLSAEGTTFRQLAAQCRYDIARQLLETSDMEMVEIAATLGYAESSVFTRAFRRWSGTTPTHWRAQHRRG
jgi:AraC-like DNA-binding protein